jgi:hypothetical protein
MSGVPRTDTRPLHSPLLRDGAQIAAQSRLQ